ncbi:ESCRT-0 subunit protein hse1 [Linnemannia schmuckeri]|uniref:ESCRT-0 subunit protein hse1 n=1 Tax=Linnemannia schmuckeri TaxID=64567 RepID=A0A9P5S5S6_9FUNG|nr:ESCRT-0 subunit protein hse1 [Linnemannia schmuckeri]
MVLVRHYIQLHRAAMTATEDTVLGGMYAPTIASLTTTKSQHFKPLMVPTEVDISSLRDDNDQEQEKEEEGGKAHPQTATPDSDLSDLNAPLPFYGNTATLETRSDGAYGNSISMQSSDTDSHELDRLSSFGIRTLKVIGLVQAVFSFPQEDDGDLPFKVGDIINVVDYLNKDWWRGVVRNTLGIFPSAYVQKLDPPANGLYPSILVKIHNYTSPPPRRE